MTFPPCSCGIKLTLFTKAYIDKMYPRKEAAIRQKKNHFSIVDDAASRLLVRWYIFNSYVTTFDQQRFHTNAKHAKTLKIVSISVGYFK